MSLRTPDPLSTWVGQFGHETKYISYISTTFSFHLPKTATDNSPVIKSDTAAAETE